jgi:hypothetical protein
VTNEPSSKPRGRGFDPKPYLDKIERGEAACADLAMRIDRDGQWHYRGSPIGRLALAKLFAGILHRLPDGTYWLVTPAEQGTIEVEDVPFVAVELRSSGEGRDRVLEFRTNLDEWVRAGPEHPLHSRASGDPPAEVPYLHVRGGLEARLSRAVYYEVMDMAEPGEDGATVGVWSDGAYFAVGRIDDLA